MEDELQKAHRGWEEEKLVGRTERNKLAIEVVALTMLVVEEGQRDELADNIERLGRINDRLTAQVN